MRRNSGSVYAEPSPSLRKRRRKPKKRGRVPGQHITEDTRACCEAIMQIFEMYEPPLKVRQICYQMSAHFGHLISKDENDFTKVGNLLKKMRTDTAFHRFHPQFRIPLDWIVDGSRELHVPLSFDSIADRLHSAANSYRRSVLAEADTLVLFLMEKDGLIDTVAAITDDWDVPIIAQPFTSISNQYATARLIRDALHEGKNAVVYHLGDYDPSGKTMFMTLCRDLPDMLRDHLDCPADWIEGEHEWDEDPKMATYKRHLNAQCIEYSDFCDPSVKVIRWVSPRLTIERLAMVRRTVDRYCSYAIRPTKRGNNKHAYRFPDEDSCELDALPPDVLRSMVRKAIAKHIPEDLRTQVRQQQRSEQRELLRIAKRYSH